MNRQLEWYTIWNRKYSLYKGHEDLHVSAGYDDLSYEEWQRLTRFFITRIGFGSEDDILEVGCGSGAFLKEVGQVGSVSGIDYADDAISKIKEVMKGEFYVSEASVIPFHEDSFDVVLSFGVFFYFADLEYANNVIDEMLRVLRPGGKIFIGDVNNLEKKDLALKLRDETEVDRDKHRVSSQKVDHLYYPVSFFEEIAKSKDFSFELIRQDVQELRFYYNAPYRFSVILRDRGKR